MNHSFLSTCGSSGVTVMQSVHPFKGRMLTATLTGSVLFISWGIQAQKETSLLKSESRKVRTISRTLNYVPSAERERERDLTHIELMRFLCRIDREKQCVSNRDGDANRQQGRAIYAWKNSERERESEMVRSEQTVQERGWFRIPSIFSLSYKPMSIFKLLLFFSRVVWNNSHVCNTGSWFDSWTSLKVQAIKGPLFSTFSLHNSNKHENFMNWFLNCWSKE